MGLQKLTDYLAQTRRQAELSIDLLSNRVKELEDYSVKLETLLNQAKKEKDIIANELKEERNTSISKYKFKERDDWKALVASVQQDRDRISQENALLEESLLIEKEKSSVLEQEIIKLNDDITELNSKIHILETRSSQAALSVSIDHAHTNGDGEEEGEFLSVHQNGMLMAPTTPIKSQMNAMSEQLSPRTAADSFKFELERVTRKVSPTLHSLYTNNIYITRLLTYLLAYIICNIQLKMERKLAQGELQARSQQIQLLKRKLNEASATVYSSDSNHINGNQSPRSVSGSSSALTSLYDFFSAITGGTGGGGKGAGASARIMHV